MSERAVSTPKRPPKADHADPELVFDRLRRHPRGISASVLLRALGGPRGVGAALQRLLSEGRAYERGGLWFHVPRVERREADRIP